MRVWSVFVANASASQPVTEKYEIVDIRNIRHARVNMLHSRHIKTFKVSKLNLNLFKMPFQIKFKILFLDCSKYKDTLHENTSNLGFGLNGWQIQALTLGLEIFWPFLYASDFAYSI